MSLILAPMNSEQAILVSDRRYTEYTANGPLYNDEQNKAAVFLCQDARVAVAFVGLARVGTFETSRTVLSALLQASQPDRLLLPTIWRFAVLMTKALQKLSVAPDFRHLTVIFAGYRYDRAQPQSVLWQVTNMVDKSGAFQKLAADKFVVCEARTALGLFGFGMRAGVALADRAILRELLAQARPARALVDKAVDTIRSAADSEKSEGLIGKQCSSIVLPADPRMSAVASYHTATVKNKIYLPSAVVSTEGASFSNQGAFIEQLDSTANPLALPKVGKDRPCPCGSGEKFKRCHGRTRPPSLLG